MNFRLRELRRQRRISQVRLAMELNVSQNTICRYETGEREAGYAMLIRIADYFDVSVDYLLGRTPNRNGAQMQPANLPDAEIPTVEQGSNMVAQVNKKVVMNTTAVIFDILDKLGNKKLTNAVSNYLMNAQYQAFRSVYSCEESNPQDLFTLNKSKYRSLCSAAMTLDLAMIDAIIESKTENTSIALSPDLLSRYFEKGTASLFTLVRNAEKSVKSKFK